MYRNDKKMAGSGVTRTAIWRMIAGMYMKETPCIGSMMVRFVIWNMPDISITEFLNGAILWKRFVAVHSLNHNMDDKRKET